MPFCSCYRRVGRLPDPDLCCSCVGRRSPGQPSRLPPGPGAVTPAREPARGCQRRPFFTPSPAAARRPAAARLPASLPAIPLPPARPGMTHRDGQSMRRRIKSTHIAESEWLVAGLGLPVSAAHICCLCFLVPSIVLSWLVPSPRAGLGWAVPVFAVRGYGTGVGVSAAETAAGGVHGFPAELTSFIGRDGPVRAGGGPAGAAPAGDGDRAGRGGQDPAGWPGGPGGGGPVRRRGVAGRAGPGGRSGAGAGGGGGGAGGAGAAGCPGGRGAGAGAGPAAAAAGAG